MTHQRDPLTAGRAPARRGLRARAGLLAIALLAGLTAGSLPAAADDEPFNVALASGENAPTLEVSYGTTWNRNAAINDGQNSPTDNYGQMWGTWGAPGNPTTDTATYTWENPVTVDSSTLYLWQNHLTGDSGVMIPEAWSLDYLDEDENWQPMTGADLTYPVPVLDLDNPVGSLPAVEAHFDEVTTTGVRLTLTRVNFQNQRRATSVIEWEVYGVNAPIAEPEPEDPSAFIDSEPVHVRTVTGQAPTLPNEVWVIGEDGPLHYVAVDWAEVSAADYAEPGTFDVAGVPDGYEDQSVEATVQVADELSDEIVDVDYSVTLTTPGVAPVLPRTVLARYADGTAASDVAVEWAAIDEAEYAETDSIFDVAGTVAGFAPGAIATVFVVEPSAQVDPIVSITFDNAPQGSGWYTSAPTLVIDAEPTASPIAAVEYSLDGGQTWTGYTEPVTVTDQGEVTIDARARAEDGGTGTATETIQVDTVVPTTAIDYVIDGTTATVTLTPTDGEPGSGVVRTIWSDGPDPSPTSEANNMFATYEEPFTLELGAEPSYVHVQSQDAAGNIEDHVTIELPTLSTESTFSATVVSRCVVGKVVLVASVTNTGAEAVSDLRATTPFGTRTIAELDAGRTTSVAVTTRLAETDAGTLSVSATGPNGDSIDVEEVYAAASCR